MRTKLALLAIMALFLSPLAAASINCPCLRPGAKGTIVKFVARDGTTDNVTLYPMDEQPSIGGVFWIYAGKAIGNDTFVVENLTISMYVNSAFKSEAKTDSNGRAEFRTNEAGEYLFTGGDANATIEISGVEEVGMVVDNGTARDNPIADNRTGENATLSPSDEGEPAVDNTMGNTADDAADGQDDTNTAPKPASQPQDSTVVYACAIALVLVAIAFLITKNKTKKSKKK